MSKYSTSASSSGTKLRCVMTCVFTFVIRVVPANQDPEAGVRERHKVRSSEEEMEEEEEEEEEEECASVPAPIMKTEERMHCRPFLSAVKFSYGNEFTHLALSF